MNKIILLFLLIITAVSCKKDNIEPLKPKGKPKREIPTKTTNLSDCYKADIAGNSIELQIQNKAEVTTGTLTYAFSGKEVTQGAFKGKWENNQIVPESYMQNATTTSQNLNLAYGYMWWLNGKSSYRLPQTQLQFNGKLIPNAPNDMYCALGKDDQKIYVIPSKKLVVIRMGNAADGSNFALSNFDNDLWEKINAVIN